MNQAIRSSWIAAIAMFVLIFGALSYVQVVGADELQANAWNKRTLLQNYCNDRGAIIVGGTPVAESVETAGSCKFQRTYTQPPQYAGITGYFSRSFGVTGLEKTMNKELAGSSDQQFLDRVGQLFLGNQPKGASVELTLDPAIQKLAYDLIPDGQRGSIVVTNPKTGAIIAMVSKPSYDPNLIATQDPAAEAANLAELNKVPGINLNQNVSGPTGALLAPGSVFKIVDTAAALNSGKYNKDSILPNPAEMSFPGIQYKLPNYAGGNCYSRDTATFAFALQQSCNTPFAKIALDLGQQAIVDQAEKFGFGQEFGDQLKLDSAPSFFPVEKLDDASLAQSSIGQRDVRATPLQINQMTAAIANGGVQMQPNLIKALRSPDLRPLSEPKPQVLRTSTSSEIARQINEWMVSVVSDGIARAAAVPGVQVAGKTGTAELGNGLNNSWFTGFAPANDPQVAVTIVMEGVDITTGAQLTSPNAKKIFEAVLNK
ncbi:penicillin-binding protein 2 [Arthrobacter sp. AL08]|uniref:peptidoglycan D,D-transpeptidase FtsI family protein n=1 Tax=Micrococcaceae TaxID=1268 RepID=UPI001CFF6762|nr:MULTISPECIES: penicillin-binding protein 2 [Micrococcaceae]MDD1476122.1 penicillin-binding protein 2 [Arthrobacter sp. H16F315]MCB5282957.1 Penicillin-binding protein A [Arthrobacter sp. ES1]MDI3242089.1 penicillin-binding protein 2 [Arthrobacter sp. AL05]MDI3277971.1 penicillin-binding protein 2 [Arthrobacter sp. AL08]MDJ0352485.1 penicillin-binding protein 2 [Pseudarthrobacter sp. PH31-O2]